ncbi:glycosyltransferase family 39 protein, partial [Candidatus Woesearchaeota archaeon]|nr:glycosyltransferase family 39 protein [Candidatus Woesearchaeota archaeon]
MEKSRLKKELLLLCGFVLVLMLFNMLIRGSFVVETLWQDRFTGCVQFIEEGRLYKNIPGCFQGPVVFETGYIVSRIFNLDPASPDFQNQMSLALTPFFYLMSALIILLINKIVEKETGKSYYLLSALLYLVLMYFSSIARFEIFLAAFLFFVGYYFLTAKHRYAQLISMVFFSLALFTKLTAVYVVGIVMVYHVLKSSFSFKEGKFGFKPKRLFHAVLPFFGVFTAFYIIFTILTPHFLLYMIYPVSNIYELSTGQVRSDAVQRGSFGDFLSQSAKSITTNYVFISIVLLFLLSCLSFFLLKDKKLHTILPLVGVPFTLTMLVMGFSITEMFVRWDFHLLYLPLFIVMVCCVMTNFMKTRSRNQIYFLVGLIVLCYFLALGLKSNVLIDRAFGLNNQVLSLIPTSVDKVLVEDNSAGSLVKELLRNNNHFGREDIVVFSNEKRLYKYDSASEKILDFLNLTNL